MTNPSERSKRPSAYEPNSGDGPLPKERPCGTAGEGNAPTDSHELAGAKPGFEPDGETTNGETADDLARASLERALEKSLEGLFAELRLLLKYRRRW